MDGGRPGRQAGPGGKWLWFHLSLPGEHAGAVALPARGSELAVRCAAVSVEHQPLPGLEPGFTHGIKSNDRALPLNRTQPGWERKPLLSAEAKGSCKGEQQ